MSTREHERPKHRGQRGRHALQRRQFQLNRGTEFPWFVAPVDGLYQKPHEAVEDVKARLQNLNCFVSSSLVAFFSETRA